MLYIMHIYIYIYINIYIYILYILNIHVYCIIYQIYLLMKCLYFYRLAFCIVMGIEPTSSPLCHTMQIKIKICSFIFSMRRINHNSRRLFFWSSIHIKKKKEEGPLVCLPLAQQLSPHGAPLRALIGMLQCLHWCISAFLGFKVQGLGFSSS